jgi:hypothetical protein
MPTEHDTCVVTNQNMKRAAANYNGKQVEGRENILLSSTLRQRFHRGLSHQGIRLFFWVAISNYFQNGSFCSATRFPIKKTFG